MVIHNIKTSHQGIRRALAVCGAAAVICTPLFISNSTHADANSGLSEQAQQCATAIAKLAETYTAEVPYDLGSSTFSQRLASFHSSPSSESLKDLEGWKENWQEYDQLHILELGREEAILNDWRQESSNLEEGACSDFRLYASFGATSWSGSDFADENWRSKIIAQNFTVAIQNPTDRTTILEVNVPAKLETVKNTERDAYMTAFFESADKIGEELNLYGTSALRSWVSTSDDSDLSINPLSIPSIANLFSKYDEVEFSSTPLCAAEGPFVKSTGCFSVYNDGMWYGYINISINEFSALIVPESMPESQYAEFVKSKYPEIFPSGFTVVDSLEDIGEWWEAEAALFMEQLAEGIGTPLAQATNTGFLVQFKANDSQDIKHLYIGIISVPDEIYEADKSSETSIANLSSGITITTTDGNVFPDAVLNVEDKKDDAKVKNQIKAGEKLLAAFDLSLFSKALNRTIPSFANGLTVYIPIDSKYSESTALARYIADDGTTPEKDIVARIVRKNSKKYAEFEVKHFSTYAVLAAADATQDTPSDSNQPNTPDDDNQQDTPSDNTQEEPTEETPSDDQSSKDSNNPDSPQTGFNTQESVGNAIVSTCGIIASVILAAIASILMKKCHKKA